MQWPGRRPCAYQLVAANHLNMFHLIWSAFKMEDQHHSRFSVTNWSRTGEALRDIPAQIRAAQEDMDVLEYTVFQKYLPDLTLSLLSFIRGKIRLIKSPSCVFVCCVGSFHFNVWSYWSFYTTFGLVLYDCWSPQRRSIFFSQSVIKKWWALNLWCGNDTELNVGVNGRR
jgi:hypothetical protein